MPSDCPALFVYGTLMKRCSHSAHAMIARHFDFMGDATTTGKMYDLVEYPGAIKALPSWQLHGELYSLKEGVDFEIAIQALDEYEGVFEPQPLFVRELVQVTVNDEKVQAWMYWFAGDTTNFTQIVSGDILKYRRTFNSY